MQYPYLVKFILNGSSYPHRYVAYAQKYKQCALELHYFHVFNIWERNKRVARQVGRSVVVLALFPLACVVMTSRVLGTIPRTENEQQDTIKHTLHAIIIACAF